jgi:phosphatidate phosphatase APP1
MQMKPFIFLAIFSILLAQNTEAKTLIISDIDDTVKMTDVLGKTSKVVFNGVFRTKAFSGMSELYQQLVKENDVIYYVSGSPKIIRIRVDEFLEENNFPQKKNLILKDKTSDDTVKFKLSAIKKILEQVKPDKLIMIGDDGEHDPEIYNKIAEEYPHLVQSIYIRAIQNRDFKGINFFSAVEIAGAEMLKGNLNVSNLEIVTQGFINQSNHSGISLEKRYCPKDGRVFLEELKQKNTDQKAINLFEKTQEKIMSSCR